jgi:protein SCO1/2
MGVSMGRRGGAGLAAGLALFVACASLALGGTVFADSGHAQKGFFEGQVEGKIGFDQRLGAQLPLDLVFTDESGRAVPLGTFFGQRPVILTFVYYNCTMLCPLVLDGVTRVLRPITFSTGEAYDVVVVSINPRESAAQAAAKKLEAVQRYGRPGAAAGFHFLTGKEEAIQTLAAATGFRYSYDPKSEQYAHAAGILIATPQGKIARYYYGIEFSPRDVRLGLVEAAGNTIGTPIDQVLLLCYHYDPLSGTYGVVVMNLIRLAGFATVLALAGYLLVMFRRDRRTRELPGGAD